jgi:hypothetical protein
LDHVGHGDLMTITERRMGGKGKRGGGGVNKETVKNDYNMMPLKNSHPRKLTSMFLVLSWLVVIVPSGLWQARG